jgi:CheY-like chemotaxis protein
MDKPIILVVEDETVYAQRIAETLASMGEYEPEIANSAQEAFNLIKKHKQLFGIFGNRVRLILLDIKMPEMDGLQFLEKLRKDYNEEKIGVIMVTAYEDEEKWDKATNGWVAGYITKPFTNEKLLSTVKRYFENEDEKYKMVMDTFEKHIERREELKGKKTE